MKKILLVFASPRKKGNTTVLAEAFRDGVVSNGATVQWVDIGNTPISGCKECFACYPNHGGCVQPDILKDIYANFASYSAVVLAGPVFFGGLPAQLKAFIDRLFSLYPGGERKESALLMTAEGGEEIRRGGMSNLEAARLGYRTALYYIDWEIRDIIIGTEIDSYGTAEQSEVRQRAYELGQRMGKE